jgi:hypothetical protein
MSAMISALSEAAPCGETAQCVRCAASVDTSELCLTCGCCAECSAGMPGGNACFNCVEVHRLVVEFLGALEEWDLERYGPGCAQAVHELQALRNRLDEHC